MLKEENYPHLENIADLLWLSKFTGMQSLVREEVEDKKEQESNSTPEIEDDEVEEDEPNIESEQEDDLEVHTDNQEDNTSSSKQKSAKAIQSPKKLALDHYREWEKAFKFINLKTPSKNRYELDEEKTVENIASTKVFDLVFKRVEEKSFFLTLVIDQGETMELWDELIKNFEQMLMTMGVFSRITIYYWDTKKEKPILYIDKALKREVSKKLVVIDGQRNLVWVMSDCIAPAWKSGETFKSIDKWATKSFTSILQMFPKEMWMGTMLFKGKHIRLSSNSFNLINKKLQIKSSKREKDTLKIPVISFDPYALQAWAKVVVNSKDNSISGIELGNLDFEVLKTPLKKEITSEMRMQRFYSQASPTAQKLAFYMSVLPVDFQVTRILQEEKLSKSNQAHVAEVFLGGLIERRKKAKDIYYDFYPKVREELNANISADESFEIMADMSNFVSSHLGIGFDFKALLADPNGAFEGNFSLHEESLAYAKLASRVLKRKGGELYTIAKKIDTKVNEIEIESFPKDYEEQVIEKLSTMVIDELVNYEIDDESLTYDGGIATISQVGEPVDIELIKINKIQNNIYSIDITFEIGVYVEIDNLSDRTFFSREEEHSLNIDCNILVEFNEKNELYSLDIREIVKVELLESNLIILYKEDNLDIDLLAIADYLNKICNYLTFRAEKEPFELEEDIVSVPWSYNKLEAEYHYATQNSLRAIFFTEKAYDNNYFFESGTNKKDDNLRIVSFHGWDLLTSLSKNNGTVYFIAMLLALISKKAVQHHKNTGCVYDFLAIKNDIDNNMREANICTTCLDAILVKDSFSDGRILDDLNSILNVVGSFSKNNLDIFSKEERTRESIILKLKKNIWDESNIIQEYEIPNSRYRADLLLNYKNKDLAVIEIKSPKSKPKAGLQQAVTYGEYLNIDYVYSTNGLEIYEYSLKNEIGKYVDDYPSPNELYDRYNSIGKKEEIQTIPYIHDSLRRHQKEAITAIIQEIINKNKRILLSLAVGAGKSVILLEVVNKLYNSNLYKGQKPRILFLSDRKMLVHQTMHIMKELGEVYEISGKNRVIDYSQNLFFATIQLMKREKPLLAKNFFDMIIIDEIPKNMESLKYILSNNLDAIQIGFSQNIDSSNHNKIKEYFGPLIYQYSYQDTINDGNVELFQNVNFQIPINDKYIYWHLQLHPDDSSYTVEQIKEILSYKVIGLDFGETDGYFENSSLENWYGLSNDRKKYFLEIKKDDIILIRHGAKPIALVKAISNYKYIESPRTPIWFKHQVEVDVLSYYNEYIKQYKVKTFNMPQTRGTLWKSKNPNTKTFQIIDSWYKDVYKENKRENSNIIFSCEKCSTNHYIDCDDLDWKQKEEYFNIYEENSTYTEIVHHKAIYNEVCNICSNNMHITFISNEEYPLGIEKSRDVELDGVKNLEENCSLEYKLIYRDPDDVQNSNFLNEKNIHRMEHEKYDELLSEYEKRELFDELNDEKSLILKQFSILPSLKIEYNFLEEIFNRKNDKEFKEILNYLHTQGFLTFYENKYQLSKIIKEYIWTNYLPSFEEIETIVDFFTQLISQGKDVESIAIENKENIIYFDSLNNILNLINIKNEKIATFLAYLGNFYRTLLEYEKAEEVLLKALKVRRDIFGENNISVATTYSNLGILYRLMGKYEQSLIFQKKSLKIRELLFGEEDLETAQSYNNLALLYENTGDYQKALVYYDKDLKVTKKIQGEEHPDIATTYNNLANLYKLLHKYSEALELYKKSLTIREQIFGEEHLLTAQSYNNLGALYLEIKNYQEALIFINKALSLDIKLFGKENPTVATRYNNLGVIYVEIKDYEKGFFFHQKSLRIREKVLGTNHMDTVQSYTNLGSFYQVQKKCIKAKEYLEKAIDAVKKLEYSEDSLIKLRRELSYVENSMAKEKKAKFNKKGKFCVD